MRPLLFPLLLLSLPLLALGVPSIPPPVGRSAIDLQANIPAAIASEGVDQLTIPPGSYVFSNSSLLISSPKDLRIDAAGATLVFFYGYGVQITGAINLTVVGLVLDADPPNYAQGQVVAIDGDRAGFEATFDDEFLMPDTSLPPFSSPGGSAGCKVSLWDRATRRMLYTTNFLNSSTPGGRSPTSFKIRLKHAQQVAGGLVVGNLVTLFPRKGFTWRCANCSGVVAENVTIWAGGNMGFLEVGGPGGNVYRRVSITRKPGSAGLMALNADGFHSSDVGIGPTLVDSEIAWTGDDFLNIHNKMKIVCRPQLPTCGAGAAGAAGAAGSMGSMGSTAMAIIDPGASFQELRAGDELLFYGLLPGLPHIANQRVGRGIVSSSRRLSSQHPSDAALLSECRGAAKPMMQPPYNVQFVGTVAASLARAQVYVVNFTAPGVPARVGRFDLVNFERRSGAHFEVRGNKFHDSCGSGGRIIGKSINGSLRDNVAARFGGFHVYSEQQWLEGALGIRNVALVNNTVVDARVGDPTHIDVLKGLVNITCEDTVFTVGGVTTNRAVGC